MTKVIGSQNNVPDVGDPIMSPWYQDTANKIVHVFATVAARDAWLSPPNGAICEAPAGVFYMRDAGVWKSMLTKTHGLQVVTLAIGLVGSLQFITPQLVIPAQEGWALIVLQVQLNMTAVPAAVNIGVQSNGGVQPATGVGGFFNAGAGQMMCTGVLQLTGVAESMTAFGSVSPGSCQVLTTGRMSVLVGGTDLS